MKINPMKQSHKGEFLDIDFFNRLIKIQNYYEELSEKDDSYRNNFEVLSRVNKLIQQNELSIEDVLSSINMINNSEANCGSGWFDVLIHFQHLAFVFGVEIQINEDWNLVKKNV